MKRALPVAAAVVALAALFLVLRPAGNKAPPPTPARTTGAAAPDVTANFDIENDAVSGPRRVKAANGQTVRISVTADVAGELHIHGYELEANAEANHESSITFVTDAPGVFEVSFHLDEDELELTELTVTR